MMYRILLPLDGSSRSERPIPLVGRLAEALPAEVELLRVVDPADVLTTSAAAITPESLQYQVGLAGEYLRDTTQRFRRVPPPATRVLQGPASKLVAEHARTERFDLIVMSSHGHTGLSGALLGSVARAVVRESSVPVLVLRERAALPSEARGLNVLVPLDGSPLAEAVLTPLLPLARALDWRLQFLWVVDPPGERRGQEGRVLPEQRVREASPDKVAYLDRLAARVRTGGMTAAVRIATGTCAESIVRCSEPDDVDLVAISTHGRHGIGRLLLGSITEHVLCHTPKPVLAVRPPTHCSTGEKVGMS